MYIRGPARSVTNFLYIKLTTFIFFESVNIKKTQLIIVYMISVFKGNGERSKGFVYV